MNRLRRTVLLAAGAAPLVLSARTSYPASAAGAPRALGYVPWWMAEAWRDMPLGQLDRLVLFEIEVRPDGSVNENDWPSRSGAIVEFAERQKIPVDMTFALHGEAAFNQVFAHAGPRERLARECSRWLKRRGISGIHLDIEAYAPVDPGAIRAFREWLARLAASARAARKSLSAFFPADDHFAPYGASSASLVDFWVAQVYDAHSVDAKKTGPLVTRSPENPVAIPRALARLMGLKVRPSAILLSVPLYGFEWQAQSDHPGAPISARGKLLTYAETPAELMPDNRKVATELAQRHGLRRDAEDTPYYAYAEDGAWMQGWYEDMHSLTRKFEPERGRGFGLAFFPLGYDRNAVVEPLLRWWRAA